MSISRLTFIALAALWAQVLMGAPLSTAITYQGNLSDNGVLADDIYDFEYQLYDTSTSGAQIGPTISLEDVAVSNGIFTVELDFGGGVYVGDDLWLEIAVRDGASVGGYTGLLPRQALTPAPFALHAADANTLDGSDSTQFAMAAQIANLQMQIDAMSGLITSLQGDLTLNAASIVANDTDIEGLQNATQFISVVGTEMIITGANLNIRSGTGATDSAINGLGNLIVGYNENENDIRTGSHNLVVGPFHSYSNYGGIVAGFNNAVAGANSGVFGGGLNTASGFAAVVSGGANNTASGGLSSISGGQNNAASGSYSSVSGGNFNQASGGWSSVVGGGTTDGAVDGNQAYANYSVVVGGNANLAGDGATPSVGESSTILGGEANRTTGPNASVSGGFTNVASGSFSSVIGGGLNNASGPSSSISGGVFNTASGSAASVSGGSLRSATGQNDWRAGGLFQDN